jgi:hypothetical protein
MNTRYGARIKQIAKVLARLCAIGMFLPGGGTLILLGDLLTGQRQG